MSTERRLLGLLRPQAGRLALGLLLTIAIAALAVAKPWPLKILVDDVFGRGRLGSLDRDQALGLAVALTAAVFALSGLLALVQHRLFLVLTQNLIRDLRGRLFAHLTRLSLGFHDERATGDSVYRLTNDTYAVHSLVLDGMVPLLSSGLTLVLTVVVMLRLDLELALLSLLSIPGAALAGRRYGARIRRSWKEYREREGEVHSHASQALTGIRAVKAFAREGFESERFIARAERSRAAMLRLVSEKTMFGLLVDLALAVSLALVTFVAARHALDGSITPGEALVFLAYAATLYGPFSEVTGTFSELQSAIASARRVFEVVDEPHVEDATGARAPRRRAEGAMRFESVRFAYAPHRPVLRSVSFGVSPGQLLALVGPSGAGKSTVLSLVMRLYDPDSGRVTLDGIDLRSLPLDWMRSQVAFVSQEPLLFPQSVRENIRYGRLDADDAAVEQAAHLANIHDELAADGRGLDTPIGEQGTTLSGGQRQRVAIARAFLKDAPVLVLDEPTSALDAESEVLVMDAINRLLRWRTGIVVAHRLATVHRADMILVLDQGRIVQAGGHEQLIEQDGLYRRLHAARFGEPSIIPLPHTAGPLRDAPTPARVDAG